MATVSGKFTFAGADEAAQDAIVQALLSNRSSEAIKEALAQSITSEAGIDGEIIVTEVLASVEGTLEFNFGEAALNVGGNNMFPLSEQEAQPEVSTRCRDDPVVSRFALDGQ